MRYSTKGSGGGASGGGGSLAVINTSLPTGEAIAANDLLTVSGDDNKVYWAMPPTDLFAGCRPVSTTGAVNDTVLQTTVISGSPAVGRMDGVQLTNGNIAVFGVAPTTNYPTLSIYSAYGVLVVAPITVEAADCSGSTVGIAALTGGGVAVTYSTGGGTNPKRAVYTSAGGVTLAATQIEAATGVASLCAAPLNDGGFVVGYHKTVAAVRQPHFARFNAAGALQGAVTQLDTVSTTDKPRVASCIAFAALNAGGFVAVWTTTNGATDSAPFFARYDAAGVIVGAKTRHGNILAVNIETGVSVCSLSDGGFAIIDWAVSANNANLKHQKYDAAGATVGAGRTFAASTANTAFQYRNGAVVSTQDGGYYAALVYNGDTNLFLDKVDAAGAVTNLTTQNPTVGSPVVMTYDPNTTEAIVQCATGADGGGASKTLRILGTTITAGGIGSGSAVTCGFIFAAANPVQPLSKNYVIGYAGSAGGSPATFKIFNTRIPKMTPIGVATASAAAAATVPAQISGAATSRLSFVQPYAVNAQGNTPPGQKLSAVGNAIIMQGIQ